MIALASVDRGRRGRAARDRLVVGVPPEAAALGPHTGAGRVWSQVRRRLDAVVDLRMLEPRGGRLRRGRPDVWLLPGSPTTLDVDRPVVAVCHGAAWLTDDSVWEHVPRAYAAPFAAATEQMLAGAARVIVPSRYTRASVVSGLGLVPEHVVVVPHGVDAGVFAPHATGGRSRVRAALGDELPYVLFASIPTISQKNLTGLRAAMAFLAAGGHPHALVIAGGPAGGESPEELAAVGAELPGLPGRLAWLGHQDDAALAGLMAEADAFCLPSLYEAFGLTALEALACGAPTVVSGRGALPEVVADAALTAEPDPRSLADALGQILARPALARQLRAAGRRRALELGWDRTARGWSDVLAGAAA